MAGLVPAIHVFVASDQEDVDARDKPGHDEFSQFSKNPPSTVTGDENDFFTDVE
jgi:hypothetical protein